MIQLYNETLGQFLTLKRDSKITYQIANTFISDKPSTTYDFDVVNDSILANSLTFKEWNDSSEDTTDRVFNYMPRLTVTKATKDGLTDYSKFNNPLAIEPIKESKQYPTILLLSNGHLVKRGTLKLIENNADYSKVTFTDYSKEYLYEYFDNPQAIRNGANYCSVDMFFNASTGVNYELIANNGKKVLMANWWINSSHVKHINATRTSSGNYDFSQGTNNRLCYGGFLNLLDCCGLKDKAPDMYQNTMFMASKSLNIDYKLKIQYFRTENVFNCGQIQILLNDGTYKILDENTIPYVKAYGCGFTGHLYFTDSFRKKKGITGTTILKVETMAWDEDIHKWIDKKAVTTPYVGQELTDNEDFDVTAEDRGIKFIEITVHIKRDIDPTDFPDVCKDMIVTPKCLSVLNATTYDILNMLGNNNLTDDTLIVQDSNVQEPKKTIDDDAASSYVVKVKLDNAEDGTVLTLSKTVNTLENDSSDSELKCTDIIPEVLGYPSGDWNFSDMVNTKGTKRFGGPLLGNNGGNSTVLNICYVYRDRMDLSLPGYPFIEMFTFEQQFIDYFPNLAYEADAWWCEPLDISYSDKMLKDLPDKSVKIELTLLNYNMQRYLQIGDTKYVVLKAETDNFITYKITAYRYVE